MMTFADEVARDIRSEEDFWTDLAELRAVGIRSTLLSASENVAISGPKLGEHTLARLLSSASVFAKAQDESSRDLAQQIAVFASLASSENAVHQGAVHVLSDLEISQDSLSLRQRSLPFLVFRRICDERYSRSLTRWKWRERRSRLLSSNSTSGTV